MESTFTEIPGAGFCDAAALTARDSTTVEGCAAICASESDCLGFIVFGGVCSTTTNPCCSIAIPVDGSTSYSRDGTCLS